MTQTAKPGVFAATVPFVFERHYFGETVKASLTKVALQDMTAEEQEKAKQMLGLTKRLIASPEITAIRTRDWKFIQYLRAIGTPWRTAFYLIPFALAEQVEAEARTWEAERNVLADAAAAAYPARIAEMREKLGHLFNAAEYPSAAAFRACFWVDSQFVDFGVPGSLKAFKSGIFERESAKVRRKAEDAAKQIEQHLARSLGEITDHLVDLLRPRANGKRPALRDGSLDRLVQYLDTLPLRNVTDCRALDAVAGTLRVAAQGVTVDDLRTDAQRRDDLAVAMEAAKDAVAQLIDQDTTRRAIVVRDDDHAAA